MIKSLFQALGFTALVILAIVVLIATLYVTMWFIAGTAVVLLFIAIFKTLQVKSKLDL